MRSTILGCLVLLLVGLGSAGEAAGGEHHTYGVIPVDPAEMKPSMRFRAAKALPAYLNWLSRGAVNLGANQDSCGACWAFAAIGCAESHIVTDAGGPLLKLSEQYVISCDADINGCCGAPFNVWDFAFQRNTQLKLDEACSYQMGDALGTRSCEPDKPPPATWQTVPCPGDIEGDSGYVVEEWWFIHPYDIEQLKANLQDGPCMVCFAVYEDFETYWRSNQPTPYRHAGGVFRGWHEVMLIGYDDASSCWIIRNSWGLAGPFGNGTGLIAYDGNCDFAINAATCRVAQVSPARTVDVAEVRNSQILTSYGARADTVHVLGGPDRSDGKFQAADGVTPDLQGWTSVSFPDRVGAFAKVWPQLQDLDPCTGNGTPQVAFVDDGVVVPGTGGSLGQSWAYGPGGYVVNSTGGLALPPYHLNNEIWSPMLIWPAGYEGALLEFDVYRHLPLANGLFYVWRVRTSADYGWTWSKWQDRDLVYYGDSPGYVRHVAKITDLLQPGTTNVQMALGANQCGAVWGYRSWDLTPAPYFDNVRLRALDVSGPSLAARDIDLFQDGFPAIGTIDYENLSANSVRLDMARSISPPSHLRNDPGDSIVVDVAVVQWGANLPWNPMMFIKMMANPLFDAHRTLPPGLHRVGAIIEGFVHGDTVRTADASKVVANRWCWDLPDTGFFFPGDVLHYFFEAQDNLFGDIRTTILPADTAGFSLFPGMAAYDPLRYPSPFIVRALPSMRGVGGSEHPEILLWNDFADRGGENEWLGALSRLGFREGQDYDIYYTHGPTSGVGNGLGGRASCSQLEGYSTLLYTSGDLGDFTLSTGEFTRDPGNDILLLDSWLSLGNKHLFCGGDDLEEELNRSGAAAVAFRDRWLSVTHNSGNVRPLIANQTAPKVVPLPGNPVGLSQSYTAYGGCDLINDFDAVVVRGNAVRVAQFTDPVGQPVYPEAAMVYNHVAESEAHVVYMPYDFMSIYTDVSAKALANLEARAQVLGQVLLFFGHLPGSWPTGGGSASPLAFGARCYPNPFNPATKVEYTLPRDGQLAIRIYNVRGELVRVLYDGAAKAGRGAVIWRGDDERGQQMASGLYFCQVKGTGQEIINKMTLVR